MPATPSSNPAIGLHRHIWTVIQPGNLIARAKLLVTILEFKHRLKVEVKLVPIHVKLRKFKYWAWLFTALGGVAESEEMDVSEVIVA